METLQKWKKSIKAKSKDFKGREACKEFIESKKCQKCKRNLKS